MASEQGILVSPQNLPIIGALRRFVQRSGFKDVEAIERNSAWAARSDFEKALTAGAVLLTTVVSSCRIRETTAQIVLIEGDDVLMPSPFPGMDPFIESQVWQDFHLKSIAVMSEMLTARVRPRYVVLVEERVYVEHRLDGAADLIVPDVTVLQPEQQVLTATR